MKILIILTIIGVLAFSGCTSAPKNDKFDIVIQDFVGNNRIETEKQCAEIANKIYRQYEIIQDNNQFYCKTYWTN